MVIGYNDRRHSVICGNSGIEPMKWNRNCEKVCLVVLALAGVLFYYFIMTTLREKSPAVVINEVCPKNLSIVSDGQGDYPGGWIELYNAGTEAVNLKDYHLSDRPHFSYRDVLPDLEIAGGGFALIYLDGRIEWGEADGECYLDFALDKGASQIFLTDASGHVVDAVTIPDNIPIDTSFGRVQEGRDIFEGMSCTPGASNRSGRQVVIPTLQEPRLSVESGFYGEPFELVMTAEAGESIYYTLDGSDPDLDGILYRGPVTVDTAQDGTGGYFRRSDFSALPYYIPEEPVDRAVIVRAAAFDRNGNRSKTVTETYFIGASVCSAYGGETGVISLVAEPADLFGYTEGIFVLGKLYDDFVAEQGEPAERDCYLIGANFNGKGRGWEREAAFTYFKDGKLLCAHNIGIRTRGKSSSEGPQKGLNLYVREMYDGSAKLSYDIFHNGRAVKRLMLKNSNSILKDGFIMSLMSDSAVTVAQCEPVSLFLNGEYWGTYGVLEKYDEQFFQDHYGIDGENIAILKNGYPEAGTEKDYYDFYDTLDFAASHDLSDAENYFEICSKIDIASLIDYYCMQIYIDNIDCTETYNMLVWKSRLPSRSSAAADGKWHWAVYDVDASLSDVTRDNLTGEIRDGRPAYFEHVLIGALLQNEGFRRQFTDRFLELLRTNFSPETVLPAFDAMAEELKPLLIREHLRFAGGSADDGAVERELAQMRDFYVNRGAYVREYLQAYFDLTPQETGGAKQS